MNITVLKLPPADGEVVTNLPNNLNLYLNIDLQGVFFDWSALKMTKSQPFKEFSELVLPKKRLRIKKIKVPELVLETVQILKFV